ncbi:MAG: AHH domain-containing protein [Pseudomonadota bacterium]|nr:AHH domain-containing protein [Pseudomonadota bacterium]
MPLPLTPLEHNIQEFEKAAREYHKLRLSKPVSVEEKKKIDEELKLRLADLDRRMRNLETNSSIQERICLQQELCDYQSSRAVPQDAKVTTSEQLELMKSDPHHPTTNLRKNMEAAGIMTPDDNCHCHHIVVGGGKRVKDPANPGGPKIQTKNAIMARARLHRYGIGINDPVNGVYLPKSMKYVPHWRFPKALPHANIHTFAYEQMVNDALTPARSADAVRNTLLRIRAILEQGSDYTFLTQKASSQYEAKINKLFAASAE